MPPIKKKNKPATPPLIDLRKELLLQVDGAKEKKHILNWDTLKAIGDATQNLIYKLAKYSLEENILPPEALKLDFIGFFEGSAVPDWRLPPMPNLLFNSDKAYNSLNANFSSVVSSIAKGNFQKIADSYNEPSVKNEMIDAVFNFTTAAGTTPLRVVKRVPNPVGNKLFSPIAIVRPMAPKIREALRVTPPKPSHSIQNTTENAFGKIILKTGKSGRLSRKIAYLHKEKEAILSFYYDSIETTSRIYNLNTMVSFTIVDESKTSVSIENQLLDIFAWGKNKEEATADLFDQFDYNYRRLHQFEDDKLSKHLLNAKKYFDLIVGNIKEK